jgi:hypothetical protein
MDEIARLATCSGGVRALPGGGVLGLDNREALASIALEPHLLLETTATWEGLAFQISQAFLVCFPCLGGTQAAPRTGLIDHAEVCARVARLLAAVVFLLGLWIGGAVDRALRAIRPKRGAVGATCVRSAASSPAQSSAVRAGRSSGYATARFTTAGRR